MSQPHPTGITEATRQYEAWLRRCTRVVEGALRAKHALMRKDVFAFLRGTYYRWIQLWPEVCADLCGAPSLLGVGDLHVESFGTWRDSEGRLAWGVDDFDEAHPLAYTNDLVRLGASLKVVIDQGQIALGLKQGCEAILDGYRETLRAGGRPIVLAERAERLEKLGVTELKQPNHFWARLNHLPSAGRSVPAGLMRAFRRSLPDPRLTCKVVRRESGVGSLGQPRFAAIASWEGGYVAREGKALVPTAYSWLMGHAGRRQTYYEQALRAAIRAHDPFHYCTGTWRLRRLSPDAAPIAIGDWPADRDEALLLHAMGCEAANVHAGTARHPERILADLHRRGARWLRDAAKAMAKAIHRDWDVYRG